MFIIDEKENGKEVVNEQEHVLNQNEVLVNLAKCYIDEQRSARG